VAMKAGRPFMSIGEVIDILKPDYADATVSKVRFLESAGLIDPERTPSGYRKFSQSDLDRLRFILKLQRDSYLPLKVIRERLAEYDAGMVSADGGAPAIPVGATKRTGDEVEPDEDLAEAPQALHLSESELAQATGLEPGQLRSLKEYGVVREHRPNGSDAYYDQDDLIVGRIARDFIKMGIEPRHLKMFRQFADRESALFEQLVSPMLKHRSPDARRQAVNALSEVTRLSKKLRHAFLRQNLRAYLTREQR
jgi:DNA-binding transcriptional MerR regulator